MDKFRQMWANVLSLEADEIEETDDFFELGGDSIKVIQLLGETAAIATNIDLENFYQNSTLREFYQYICDNDVNRFNASCPDSNGTRHLASVNSTTSNIVTEIDANGLYSALNTAGINKDTVVKAAMVTPIQKFFLNMAMEGNVGLLNYVYEVEGPNIERGLKRLTELLEVKNPILRTTIVDTGKDFAQVLVDKSMSTWVHTSDFKRYMQETMSSKMNLGTSPVQYCFVANDKTYGKNLFVISIHHMFCDAFSRFLIEKEMLQILVSPTDYANENERPWFGDFVTHIRSSNADDKVFRYWENYLHGANMENIHPWSECSGELDSEIIEKIPGSLLASRSQSVQTHFILAAWCLALSKHSGLRDITFGLCRHGRSHPYQDVRRIIGPLVSATPFRVKIEENHELADDLVRRVQDEIFQTARWEQGYITGVYPSGDGRPWVQSLVNLKSELYAMPEGYEDEGKAGDISRLLTRRDLQEYDMKSDWAVLLLIHQKKGVICFTMYYKSTLLSPRKAEALFGDFKRSVKGLGSSNDKTVGDLLV